jgi:hypothetical protein
VKLFLPAAHLLWRWHRVPRRYVDYPTHALKFEKCPFYNPLKPSGLLLRYVISSSRETYFFPIRAQFTQTEKRMPSIHIFFQNSFKNPFLLRRIEYYSPRNLLTFFCQGTESESPIW